MPLNPHAKYVSSQAIYAANTPQIEIGVGRIDLELEKIDREDVEKCQVRIDREFEYQEDRI
jgi:hypothetical protein